MTARPARPGPVVAGRALERAWAQERTAVLATVARRLGDLQLAEDAVQEAFAAAATRWPVEGVPDRPGGWLTTAAWRKAIDRHRRDRFPVGPATAEVPDAAGTADPDPSLAADPVVRADDVLALVLTCCHPALAAEAQVALTLRHVVGLTDRQIAARFLVAEATLTKRLVRARAKIRDARISFEPPDRDRLGERLAEVHAVVYLIFTEGYLSAGSAADEPTIRADLCDEAVWLARQLHRLVPADRETTGLLALLLLHGARAAARVEDGRLVPYAEQDRSRWDAAAVEEAKALLATTAAPAPGPRRPPPAAGTVRPAGPGPYQLQAAIALLHAAPGPDGPAWPLIADLYGALARQDPSPVVGVNRAVAVGRADGVPAGLAALAPLLADRRLHGYVPLHAAHADLLDRAGDPRAAAAWRAAAAMTADPAQRAALERRAATATRAGDRRAGSPA